MTTRDQGGQAKQNAETNRERIAKNLQGFSPIFELTIALSTAATVALLIVQTCFNAAALEQTAAATRAAQTSADAAGAAVKQAQDQFDAAEKGAAEDAARSKAQFEASLEELSAQRSALEEQVRQSREAVAVSRQQMIESLRAQLTIDRVDVDFDKNDVPVSISVRNSGTLPAIRFTEGAAWAFGAITSPDLFTLRTFANALAPGGSQPVQSKANIPASRVSAVLAGQAPLRIWFVLLYGDRLTEWHPAEILCFKYDAEDKNFNYCSESEPYPQAALDAVARATSGVK